MGTTLLELAARTEGAEVLSLDNPRVLRAARTDPSGFIDAAPKPLFLDEVQRGGGDFRWLSYLRDRLGERFVHGFVCHLGERPLPFGDRLTALPISSLWRLG